MAYVRIPLAVALSVYSGATVGGCGWPSSIKARQIGQARLLTMHMPPVLASADEDIKFLIALHMMYTGGLCMVLLCLDGFY